jgi:hypothetical protein
VPTVFDNFSANVVEKCQVYIAYHWIYNELFYEDAFVFNRVGFIVDYSSILYWLCIWLLCLSLSFTVSW